MKRYRIQEARKAAKITQDELAKVLNVNRATLSRYESGAIDPPASQLQAIADALGVSMSYLTGEPIRLNISMPDYPIRLPTREEIARMAPAEQKYYYLRLLADTAPDTLKKKLIDCYDKLNKLGQVEVVRRTQELTGLPQYTEPDPKNKSPE